MCRVQKSNTEVREKGGVPRRMLKKCRTAPPVDLKKDKKKRMRGLPLKHKKKE
jgi:hypothetical protein